MMATIKQLFFWSFVVFLGLMIATAGAGYAENPNNNLWVGIGILYTGMGMLFYGVIQMVRRDRDE
tara:strand:- start:435 stop:629 length:195 start_codon:yes stop_codon:yes gene_type:complete